MLRILITLLLAFGFSNQVWAENKINVAFCGFRVADSADTESRQLAELCADMLEMQLVEHEGFNTLERKEISRILREQGLSLNWGNQGALLKVGKLIKAKYLIYGDLVIKDKSALEIKITESSTGAIMIKKRYVLLREHPDVVGKEIASDAVDAVLYPDSSRPTLSIQAFENQTRFAKQLNLEFVIRQRLTHLLSNQGGIRVLERDDLRALLNEDHLASHPENRKRAGQYLLSGTIMEKDREGILLINIQLRRMDKQGQSWKGEFSGPLSDWKGSSRKMAQFIAKHMGEKSLGSKDKGRDEEGLLLRQALSHIAKCPHIKELSPGDWFGFKGEFKRDNAYNGALALTYRHLLHRAVNTLECLFFLNNSDIRIEYLLASSLASLPQFSSGRPPSSYRRQYPKAPDYTMHEWVIRAEAMLKNVVAKDKDKFGIRALYRLRDILWHRYRLVKKGDEAAQSHLLELAKVYETIVERQLSHEKPNDHIISRDAKYVMQYFHKAGRTDSVMRTYNRLKVHKGGSLCIDAARQLKKVAPDHPLFPNTIEPDIRALTNSKIAEVRFKSHLYLGDEAHAAKHQPRAVEHYRKALATIPLVWSLKSMDLSYRHQAEVETRVKLSKVLCEENKLKEAISTLNVEFQRIQTEKRKYKVSYRKFHTLCRELGQLHEKNQDPEKALAVYDACNKRYGYKRLKEAFNLRLKLERDIPQDQKKRGEENAQVVIAKGHDIKSNLYPDGDHLWHVTNAGVHRVDPDSGKLKLTAKLDRKTRMRTSNITLIRSDARHIYVAVKRGGLFRYDKKRKTWTNFSKKNILPNDWISCMIARDKALYLAFAVGEYGAVGVLHGDELTLFQESEAPRHGVYSLAIDHKFIYAGMERKDKGIRVMNRKTNSWKKLSLSANMVAQSDSQVYATSREHSGRAKGHVYELSGPESKIVFESKVESMKLKGFHRTPGSFWGMNVYKIALTQLGTQKEPNRYAHIPIEIENRKKKFSSWNLQHFISKRKHWMFSTSDTISVDRRELESALSKSKSVVIRYDWAPFAKERLRKVLARSDTRTYSKELAKIRGYRNNVDMQHWDMKSVKLLANTFIEMFSSRPKSFQRKNPRFLAKAIVQLLMVRGIDEGQALAYRKKLKALIPTSNLGFAIPFAMARLSDLLGDREQAESWDAHLSKEQLKYYDKNLMREALRYLSAKP